MAAVRRIRRAREADKEDDIRIGDDGSHSLTEVIGTLEKHAGIVSHHHETKIESCPESWTMDLAIARGMVPRNIDTKERANWLAPYKAFGSINWQSNFTACNSYSKFFGVKQALLVEANRLRKQRATKLDEAQSQRVAATSVQRVARGRAGRRRADRKRAIEENKMQRSLGHA